MNRKQARIWLLAVIAFSLVLTWFVVPVFFSLNGHTIPELGGDGIKNYYSYLYHCLYDTGWHFSGMNYPYGESIVYADGQPLLSFIIIKLQPLLHLTPDSIVGIMYRCMAAAYALGIVFVYKTLVHYKVAPLWAMLFAGLIICTSPQQLRMFAHFGLSYVCIIPMLIYWLSVYDTTANKKYAVYILLLGCIAAFTHPYYIAIFLVVTGGFIVIHFFSKGSFRSKLLHVLPLLITLVMLMAIVKTVMHYTDTLTDRPVYPHGIMENLAVKNDILQSPYSVITKWLNGDSTSGTGEGFAYIGIVAIVTIIATVIYLITSLVLRRKREKEIQQPMPVKWAVIAFAILFLAMGVPFVWNAQLLDHMSMLRQFRTLGRFSWVFYYIITIYSVVYLYHYYMLLATAKKQWMANALLTVALIVWGVEASGYIKSMHHRALPGQYNYDEFYYNNEQYDCRDVLEKYGYKAKDFQAVMMLPHTHIGSEKIWIGQEDTWAYYLALRACMDTGLPLMDVMMSRTSWSQTFKHVKTLGGPYTDKPLLQELKSAKPLLLMWFIDKPLDDDAMYLINLADSIGTLNTCRLYKLDPAKVLAADKQYKQTLVPVIEQMHTADTCLGCLSPYVINHFDDTPYPNALFGKGADTKLYADKDTFTVINRVATTTDVRYEFSVWVLEHADDFRGLTFVLTMYDSTGKELGTEKVYSTSSTDNKGMWLRAGTYFTIPKSCTRLVCTVQNDAAHSGYIAIDEMLLRPANVVVISKSATGSVMVNNHIFNK